MVLIGLFIIGLFIQPKPLFRPYFGLIILVFASIITNLFWALLFFGNENSAIICSKWKSTSISILAFVLPLFVVLLIWYKTKKKAKKGQNWNLRIAQSFGLVFLYTNFLMFAYFSNFISPITIHKSKSNYYSYRFAETISSQLYQLTFAKNEFVSFENDFIVNKQKCK